MSRLHDIWKALAGQPTTPSQPQSPQTQIVAGNTADPFKRFGFMDPETNRAKQVQRWRNIYRRGGPVAQCIDVYALFCLTNGWQLANDPDLDPSGALKDMVQEWIDQSNVDLDSIMWQGIIECCLCGEAYQEILPNRGGGIWGLIPRDSSTFRVQYDETGRVTGYTQVIPLNAGLNREIPIDVDRLLVLTLFPVAGEMHGISLIERAEDDINRDTDMIESITVAVHRHGTRKNQVKVGALPDGQMAPAQPDLEQVRQMYQDVGPKNDWITGPDVDIRPVDDTLSNLQDYSNITFQRLAASMGVPEEILGLGAGRGTSAAATANVRVRCFLDRVSTIQEIVNRTYSRHLLDKITGVPGAVWIEFNDPSPDDEATKATWIAQMRQGMDPEAVCPAAWVREQFGIPPDEDIQKTIDRKYGIKLAASASPAAAGDGPK